MLPCKEVVVHPGCSHPDWLLSCLNELSNISVPGHLCFIPLLRACITRVVVQGRTWALEPSCGAEYHVCNLLPKWGLLALVLFLLLHETQDQP